MTVCDRCGTTVVRSGRGLLVGVTFTVEQLADIAYQTIDPDVREKALAAIRLVDPTLEKLVRESIA